MQGSKLELTKVLQFASDNVIFNGQGVLGTATAGATTNIDLLIADDAFLTGGTLLTNGSVFGDYADMQVVDVDNILGYGAGTVLNQFVTKQYMQSDSQKQRDHSLSYLSKIYAGLYLRIVYHSTGGTNVSVAMNYDLHKARY